MFKFSRRSLNNLEGLTSSLVEVCYKAIDLTEVDFGIICGMRTYEEQLQNYKNGATQTMHSKHLTGDAVDVMAYIGSRGSWELELYYKIADAFKQAAISENVKVRWGGAWSVPDIREWKGSMEDAQMSYIDLRRSQGQKPFLDSGHFELN